MNYVNGLLDLNRIKERILDEESEQIFRARLDFLMYRDDVRYFNAVRKIKKEWRCMELEEWQSKAKKGIVIFGCGHDGILNKGVLNLCGYHNIVWCDSNIHKIGTVLDGKEVKSVDEIVERYSDWLILIGSAKYADEMEKCLLEKGWPGEYILKPRYGILVANCGNQYFDICGSIRDEIFVDGGSFSGDTIASFISWSKAQYNKVFAIELQRDMCAVIEKECRAKEWKNICLSNGAVWNKKEKICFSCNQDIEMDAGAHVTEGIDKNSEVGNDNTVYGLDIDSIVGEEKVTFIKMDIEGCELKGLEGAQKTITREQPILAICIYHKPYDIVEISSYILSLNDNYRFIIRHYASNMWETVLYAVSDRDIKNRNIRSYIEKDALREQN